MWPDDRLVLRRTIKVKGRIIWLKISTKGKNNIKAAGEPYGSIWDTNPRNCVLRIEIIKETHKDRETEQVK